MKKLLLPLLGIILMISCNKENIFDKAINKTAVPDAQFKSSKLDVCHHEGNNNWHTINISINALPAHIAHGDIVPDADGDGYTKLNPCGVGSQDDCDDNNAAINPAATEICGNNKDDNCNGQIDENCFPMVTICNQVWMLKNLDVDKYRNGDPIQMVTDNTEWEALTTGAYCYYNNDSATYAAIYGKLYNWYAVTDPRGLAPAGWHVPSDAEWNILVTCIDPSADTTSNYSQSATAGGAMKETGTSHWNSPNAGATNTSGFTGLPGGFRNFNGSFDFIGRFGGWWSTMQNGTTFASSRYIDYVGSSFTRFPYPEQGGWSVRCVRN
jgi:uncharacterized protein (TIGR02145 family)